MSGMFFWDAVYTLCSEKNTPTHVFCYISVENAWICTEFSGNVYWKTSILKKIRYSLLSVTSCWRHISMFVIYGFYRWRQDIWQNVKTHQLVIVLTGPKNMLNHHAIFHCKLFQWFIFLAECEMRDPQLCWCWQVYAHCVTAWMTTCPLSVKRLETAGHVNYFYLKVSFHQYSIVCPLPRNSTSLRLHNPCWLASILSDVCL